MKYLDPSESVLLPVVISVRAETASLLNLMADDMNASLDEVLSAIAEDSVSELNNSKYFSQDIEIPDACSTDYLKRFIQ